MAAVRLDNRTELALKRLTARRGQTRSEVIRDAIEHLVEEEEKQTSAFERLQPFIGIIEGADPKLSENAGNVSASFSRTDSVRNVLVDTDPRVGLLNRNEELKSLLGSVHLDIDIPKSRRPP